jgi:hypothetical protein
MFEVECSSRRIVAAIIIAAGALASATTRLVI